MLEYNKDTTVSKEILVPLKIKAQQAVFGAEHLLEEKPACVSFRNDRSAEFKIGRAHV